MAEENADAPARKVMRSHASGRKGIHWDEETIAEHDKERGTRMKIDEPKTPYHAPQSPEKAFSGAASAPTVESAPVLPAAELQARLVQAKEEAADPRHRPSFAMGADELAEARQERKGRDFRKRRAAHYNEFKRAKELLASQAAEDEEDGGDEGDEGEG